MTEIEERLAHLIRAVDDLSDVVARQDRDITRLQRRVEMLMTRAADRDAQGGGPGDAPPADQRPPHW